MSVRDFTQHKIHSAFAWTAIGILLVVAVSAIVLILISKTNETKTAAKTEAELFTEQVNEEKNFIAFGGTIAQINGGELTIEYPPQSVKVKITKDTIITTGAEGKIAAEKDLKPQMRVQVVYNESSKDLKTLWYE